MQSTISKANLSQNSMTSLTKFDSKIMLNTVSRTVLLEESQNN